jgi:hypothetical protein
MAILNLANEFRLVENSILGRGPDHPTEPHRHLAPIIDEFIRENSFLNSHPDYIEFLRKFGAGGIFHPDYKAKDFVFVSIYGFDSSAGGEMYEEGVKLINDDGFFVFAEAELRETVPKLGESADKGIVNFGFAFDGTGERENCVYRSIYCEKRFGPYRPYCVSFSTWLEKVIRGQRGLSA